MFPVRILFAGDVCQNGGSTYILKSLSGIKQQYGIDFTVVNGENSAPRNGISAASADNIFAAGADVITTGNHCFGVKGVGKYFDSQRYILRPANMKDANAHGKGYLLYDMGHTAVAVINLSGLVFMAEQYTNPFVSADNILKDIGDQAKIILVDFHGEATAEKRAMGYYLAGRVTAVLGTHTHVQTADANILPGGTAYITDVGMTGPIESVLGIKTDIIIRRFAHDDKLRFEAADGACRMDCVIIETDGEGKAASIEAYSFT